MSSQSRNLSSLVDFNATEDALLFLFDIGTMFCQDTAKAIETTTRLNEAGATFLKAEVLHSADICLNDDTQEHYLDPDRGMVSERYRDLVERKVLPLATYAKIFDHARGLAPE